MESWIFRAVTLTFSLVVSMPASGLGSDEPTRPFRAADYPAERFRVSEAEHRLGGTKIRIVQVREKSGSTFQCRGWLEIHPEGGKPRWVYRGNLEPVGSAFGLFVPHSQPSRELFLLVELHEYTGTLLIIDKKGGLREVPGGSYFIDVPHRLLFSKSFSDEPPALAVIDLDSGKAVFQGLNLDLAHWYRLGSELFFNAYGKSGENRTTGYFFDFTKKSFETRPLTPDMWSRAEPVELTFNPNWYQDCTSEPRYQD